MMGSTRTALHVKKKVTQPGKVDEAVGMGIRRTNEPGWLVVAHGGLNLL